jgi:hypothetical protein
MNFNHRIPLFLVAILALFAIPNFAHSFDFSDLSRKILTNENVCKTKRIGDLIDNYASGFVKNAFSQAKNIISQSFTQLASELASCTAKSMLGSIPGIGGAVSGAVGAATGSVGDCVRSVGGQIEGILTEQARAELERNILGSCEARDAWDAAFSDARQILAENGRDGGPAYVEDWRAFKAQNQYRGLQIARNEFANTNHCSWVSGYLQGFYNYDPAHAVALVGEYEDGRNSYTRDAECTLPEGFDPYDPAQQTGEALAALMMPQNNIWGAYLMAEEEINKQIAEEEEAAQNEYAYTGGVGALREINPATGDSCEVMASDGSTCLKYTKINQPAAGVQAEIQAERQANYDWLAIHGSDDTLTGTARELQAQITSSLLSAIQPLPKFEYKLGASSKKTADYGAVPTPVCQDLTGEPQAQLFAQTVILQSELAAAQQHPELLTADRNAVLPGQNEMFLLAICEVTIMQTGICRPSTTSDRDLVVTTELGAEVTVSVIAPDGAIRKPGQVTRACPAGID